MARDTFYIKQNDTGAQLQFELTPSSVDLTGASVVFNMRDRATKAVKVSRGTAVVVTATVTPTVKYPWQAADTDTAGDFEGEFEVTFVSGQIETYPNDGFIPIHITEDVA